MKGLRDQIIFNTHRGHEQPSQKMGATQFVFALMNQLLESCQDQLLKPMSAPLKHKICSEVNNAALTALRAIFPAAEFYIDSQIVDQQDEGKRVHATTVTVSYQIFRLFKCGSNKQRSIHVDLYATGLNKYQYRTLPQK